MEYIALVFKNENDEFVGVIPDIDETAVYGDTIEELKEALEDFTELSLEDEKLPFANSIEHYSQDVLRSLSLPTDCQKNIMVVTEEDEMSYEAKMIVQS